MSVTEEEARTRAQAFLERHPPPQDRWLIVKLRRSKTNDGFIVAYQSERYIKTGDLGSAGTGNVPLFVSDAGDVGYDSTWSPYGKRLR